MILTFLSQWGYLEFIFTESFIEKYITFLFTFTMLNLIGCQGDKRVNFIKMMFKNLLRNRKVEEADTYLLSLYHYPLH